MSQVADLHSIQGDSTNTSGSETVPQAAAESDGSSGSESEVARLQASLAQEQARSKALAEEVKSLKTGLVAMQAQSEQEDEYRVNKLSKHVEQIKKEKQDLLRQVEQEEEYITNTLVKKLEQVRHEKVDLENQLEQEEEFITNKLQKQLLTVLNEKSKLEKRLDAEVTDHHRLARLESEAATLRTKLSSLEQEHDDYEKKNDQMKDQLLKLKTENFALAQRIKREQERFTQVNEDKLRLMSNIEMGDERRYNTRIGTGMRARSVSLPAKPQLPSSKSAPNRSSASPSSPPLNARSPPLHSVPHPHPHGSSPHHVVHKPQGRELIAAPVRIRDPNSLQRNPPVSPGGVPLVGATSSRSYAAIRDMGTRTFMQLWRMEAAYTNRTQQQDIAIDLSSISNCALDKNDPRCLTLSFSHATTSPNPIHFYNQKSSANTDTTKVSHTIDALTLTFEKEEQAEEWLGLLKELSVC